MAKLSTIIGHDSNFSASGRLQVAGERYVYKFVCDPEALFTMAFPDNHRPVLKSEPPPALKEEFLAYQREAAAVAAGQHCMGREVRLGAGEMRLSSTGGDQQPLALTTTESGGMQQPQGSSPPPPPSSAPPHINQHSQQHIHRGGQQGQLHHPGLHQDPHHQQPPQLSPNPHSPHALQQHQQQQQQQPQQQPPQPPQAHLNPQPHMPGTMSLHHSPPVGATNPHQLLHQGSGTGSNHVGTHAQQPPQAHSGAGGNQDTGMSPHMAYMHDMARMYHGAGGPYIEGCVY